MTDIALQPTDHAKIVQLLLDDGTKSFALQEFEAAMQKYGEACQILDQTYGELAPECGDAYFLYGRALLNYAIQQSSVLGGRAVKAAEAEIEDDAPALTNNPRFHFEGEPDLDGTGVPTLEDEGTGDMDEDPQEDDDDDDDDEGTTAAAGSSSAAAAEPDLDDFEYAWDVLDVARLIYSRADTDEARLRLADVYLCLGDISMETEKFDQAIHDYREAIKLKSDRLPPSDRQLAEAHYKLALVLEYSSRRDEQRLAVEHTEMAVRVLQNRVEALRAAIVERDGGKGKGKESESVAVGEGTANGSGEAEADEREVRELEELIPDMEQKVEDLRAAQSAKDDADDLLRDVLAITGGPGPATAPTSSSASSAQPVHDLTSLVRKKVQPAPPPEDEGQEDLVVPEVVVEGEEETEPVVVEGEEETEPVAVEAAGSEATVETEPENGGGSAVKRKAVEEAGEAGEAGAEDGKRVKI